LRGEIFGRGTSEDEESGGGEGSGDAHDGTLRSARALFT
jgi:hypothetical protein